MSEPVKVLFVCTANICRSAYAQVRAEAMLGREPSVRVMSAGTWGFDAAPMDPPMADQARRRALDPSAFRSRRLTGALATRADLILTATLDHRAFVLEEHPYAVAKTFTFGQFAAALEQVPAETTGHALIAAARARLVQPTPAMDVVDPYRRGPEAASACADHLDSLLDVILGRLAPHQPFNLPAS